MWCRAFPSICSAPLGFGLLLSTSMAIVPHRMWKRYQTPRDWPGKMLWFWVATGKNSTTPAIATSIQGLPFMCCDDLPVGRKHHLCWQQCAWSIKRAWGEEDAAWLLLQCYNYIFVLEMLWHFAFSPKTLNPRVKSWCEGLTLHIKHAFPTLIATDSSLQMWPLQPQPTPHISKIKLIPLLP